MKRGPSTADFSTTRADERHLIPVGIQTCVNKLGLHKGDYQAGIHSFLNNEQWFSANCVLATLSVPCATQ